MKLKLLTIALLATGISSTAIASTATTENSWYASAFGGYTYAPSNIKTYYYGYLLSDVNYRYGYNVGASLGYKATPLRYELQYNYLYVDTDRYSVNHIKAREIDGGTKANVVMANAYYDFTDAFAELTPFLGVGLGYSFMHATLNSTSRFDKPHYNANQNSFAYQGTAGLTYNFSENWAINTVYRYMGTTNKSNWGKTLQAQMANLEVVYRFDTGNYK